jgi:hypothetical protein
LRKIHALTVDRENVEPSILQVAHGHVMEPNQLKPLILLHHHGDKHEIPSLEHKTSIQPSISTTHGRRLPTHPTRRCKAYLSFHQSCHQHSHIRNPALHHQVKVAFHCARVPQVPEPTFRLDKLDRSTKAIGLRNRGDHTAKATGPEALVHFVDVHETH